MICISCWSHGNRFDFIVAFLWSCQALIHFSFTLLAKHIMWIWSFVPDSPRLTSLSPQTPDASQRSHRGGEEFHWIQRLLWVSYDSSTSFVSPASQFWPLMIPWQTVLLALGDCSCAQAYALHGCMEDLGFLLFETSSTSRSVRMSKPLIRRMRKINFGFTHSIFHQSLICWWSCKWVARFLASCSLECFLIDSI